MHRATITHDGVPIARIVCDDDARIELRLLRDDTILYVGTLEQLGRQLLYDGFPVLRDPHLMEHGRRLHI